MSEFYHITLIRKTGVNDEAIKAKLSAFVDWYQCNQLCYIVYTSRSAPSINNTLADLFMPEGRIIILRLDLRGGRNNAFAGFDNPELWNWLDKEREKSPVTLPQALEKTLTAASAKFDSLANIATEGVEEVRRALVLINGEQRRLQELTQRLENESKAVTLERELLKTVPQHQLPAPVSKLPPPT